jgi:nucleotide-binding universal stress UspA family protein
MMAFGIRGQLILRTCRNLVRLSRRTEERARMFQHIAVAFNGSDVSSRALHCACSLAFQNGVGLLVILLDEMPVYSSAPTEPDEFSKYSPRILGELRREALAAADQHRVRISFDKVIVSMPSDFIRCVRSAELDLLVVGQQRARSFFWLFGTFAESLVREVGCSILVVR